MPTALIQSGIVLATQILQFINTQSARKYVDQMANIQKSILAEEALGYDSDDAKVEDLYKQLNVVWEAIKNEVAVFQAQGGQAQSAAPVAPSLGSHPVA